MKSLLFSFIFLSCIGLNAATFVVDIVGDVDDGNPYVLGNGTNSLRKCIRLANTNAAPDVINFNITPLGGVKTISLASALTISGDNNGVTINGFSQSGASANTAAIGAGLNGVYTIEIQAGGNNGFDVASDLNIIKGLVIGGGSRGVNITGNTNKVLGCYIGTDVTGLTASANVYGVYIDGDGSTANNAIGDATASGVNVISANSTTGIYI